MVAASPHAGEATPLIPKAASRGARGQGYHAEEDEDDIDSRFRRWKEAVKQRIRKGKYKARNEPEWLISVFQRGDEHQGDEQKQPSVGTSSHIDRRKRQLDDDVSAVRQAIDGGLLPQMIQTGSSGSYFAKRIDRATGRQKTCGVFKPSDEEPYGVS